MAHLTWTNSFLVQTIIITFIYLLALFIVQNLKKFLDWIQSYEDAQFLGPKWPICANENFFQKTCIWALFLSFMPIYIPRIKVRYYLKWNIDKERILEYHWLRAIFGYNLRTRFLPNMLFSQTVSEKTNESILRKLTERLKDRRKDRQKDGKKDGKKDGQTLFCRTLLAKAADSIKTKVILQKRWYASS